MRSIEPSQQLVNELASIARIRPPRLRVFGGRNVFYSPFTHRIYLSSQLVAGMNRDALDTLLAHEIGHAQRRGKMLRNFVRFSVLPIAGVLIGGALTFICYQVFGAGWQAIVAMGVGLLVTGYLDRINTPIYEAASLIEEFSADTFAESVAGAPGAMERALRDAARIEDGGVLGAQAELRIQRLKSA